MAAPVGACTTCGARAVDMHLEKLGVAVRLARAAGEVAVPRVRAAHLAEIADGRPFGVGRQREEGGGGIAHRGDVGERLDREFYDRKAPPVQLLAE